MIYFLYAALLAVYGCRPLIGGLIKLTTLPDKGDIIRL